MKVMNEAHVARKPLSTPHTVVTAEYGDAYGAVDAWWPCCNLQNITALCVGARQLVKGRITEGDKIRKDVGETD